MKNDRTLRVAIDAHMLGDMSGGNETFYRNVLQNMYPSEGMKIFLFVKEGIDVSTYEDRFTIVYLPKHGASVRNLIDIPLLCIKHHIDVLHMQYFIPFFRPCPVVTTIHDICFEHYKDIFTMREYVRQKLLVRYAAKHSNRIITVSEFSKKDISDCYGITERKITVTYNAVSDAFRKLETKELNVGELCKKFGICGKYVLCVCNLQPRKNLKRLILAFGKLCSDYQYEGQLVIVGKKAWRYDEIFDTANETENNIKEMSNTDKIIFTDYVTEFDLVRLYNGAQCFVYPSYYEGFGIPPLEAMSCGVPVAVAETSSLPEVVGDAGRYFDPFSVDSICNSMMKLIRVKEKAEEYDKLQREMAIQKEKYSWSETAEKIVKVYLNMLNPL